MSTVVRTPSRTTTQAEVKRDLSRLLDELERHVVCLGEEGITEVAGALPEEKQSPPAPVKAETNGRAELQAIALAVAACKKCPLHAKRHQAVPGQGSPNPDILFVGEGPGEDEDRQGLAFVGRAGQLLTRLIRRMGYTREQVFIANVVKCRPPENRKPMPDEIAECFPYLKAQIAALQPKVIVALGAVALEALVAPGVRISRLRGQWQTFGEIPLMPTYHPAYLLRNQSAMWDVWHDMQQVLERLVRSAPPSAKHR